MLALDSTYVVNVSGCIYAVPCEWAVHYGRSGVQLSLHNGRTWFRGVGPDQQAVNAETQSNTSAGCCICLHSSFVLHVSPVHAHETSVSFAYFPTFILCLALNVYWFTSRMWFSVLSCKHD